MFYRSQSQFMMFIKILTANWIAIWNCTYIGARSVLFLRGVSMATHLYIRLYIYMPDQPGSTTMSFMNNFKCAIQKHYTLSARIRIKSLEITLRLYVRESIILNDTITTTKNYLFYTKVGANALQASNYFNI